MNLNEISKILLNHDKDRDERGARNKFSVGNRVFRVVLC